METIEVKVIKNPVDISRVIEIYKSSGLNRPVDDIARIRAMYENSNLIVGAFTHKGKMVGIARSLTDFSHACYLADLAVDKEYQGYGIGKKLIKFTQEFITSKCTFLLLSSPSAMTFYENNDDVKVSDNCFLKKREY